MKICHVTSAHTVYDSRIFLKECCSLAEVGYEVYLVAPNAVEKMRDGVNIVGFPVTNKGRMYRMICVAKDAYHKALSIDADVYHLHDPELLRFALRLKQRGKKVIFDSHEFYGLQIWEKKYLPRFLRYSIAIIYMRYEAYVCRRIDAVIQVCTVQGKDYFQGRCKRSFFISNAVDLSLFMRDFASSSFDKCNSVIHVGSLTYERGITTLVRTSGLTKAKIKLVGNFSPERYKNELEQMKEYENIEYLGYIDKEDLPKILESCFAGISTLLNIGQYAKVDVLSTKVYEYMAMGMPVILSNSTYNMRLNDLRKFGICVAPDNAKEIADAINYLHEHPDKAKEMGMNGRKLVEERFNWEIEKRKLLALYAELI